MTSSDTGLTPDYAVIGTVLQGLDVTDRIGKLGDSNGHPTQPVEIEHATLSNDLADKFIWRMIKVEIAYRDSRYRRCKHFFWLLFLQELHILGPLCAFLVRPTAR